MSARQELIGTVVLGLFHIGAASKGLKFDSKEEEVEYAKAQFFTNETFRSSCSYLINKLFVVMEREVTRIRSGRN